MFREPLIEVLIELLVLQCLCKNLKSKRHYSFKVETQLMMKKRMNLSFMIQIDTTETADNKL